MKESSQGWQSTFDVTVKMYYYIISSLLVQEAKSYYLGQLIVTLEIVAKT